MKKKLLYLIPIILSFCNLSCSKNISSPTSVNVDGSSAEEVFSPKEMFSLCGVDTSSLKLLVYYPYITIIRRSNVTYNSYEKLNTTVDTVILYALQNGHVWFEGYSLKSKRILFNGLTSVDITSYYLSVEKLYYKPVMLYMNKIYKGEDYCVMSFIANDGMAVVGGHGHAVTVFYNASTTKCVDDMLIYGTWYNNKDYLVLCKDSYYFCYKTNGDLFFVFPNFFADITNLAVSPTDYVSFDVNSNEKNYFKIYRNDLKNNKQIWSTYINKPYGYIVKRGNIHNDEVISIQEKSADYWKLKYTVKYNDNNAVQDTNVIININTGKIQ